MNLFNLLESPNLGAPSNRPGAQDAGDQHSPSPIGSGTSKREAKKKSVTMMGVGVRESKIVEVWEPITESLRDGEYYTFRVFFDDGTDETLNFSSDDIDWDRVGARRGKQVVDVKRQGGIQGSQSDSPRKPHDFPDDRGLARAQRAYDKQLPEGVAEAAGRSFLERVDDFLVDYSGSQSGDAYSWTDGKKVIEVEMDPNDSGTVYWALGIAGRTGKTNWVESGSDNPKDALRVVKNFAKHPLTEGIRVVDQDYDLDQIILTLDIEGKRASFTYTDYDENFANAERRDVFDQLQEQPWYAGLDHPTKMEILDAAYRAIRGLEPGEYQPTVGDEPLDEAGPFSYGAKKPRKGSVADLAAKKRKEQERGRQPIEPRDQMVGVAKILPKDVSEGKEDLSKYSTERLKAYVEKVSGGGVPAFGSGAQLKRVQAELKRREQGVSEGSVQDKLHRRHQELRKKSGLPNPDYYRELRATYDLPDAERYAKAAELKKKYKVKEGILDRAAPKMPKPRNPAEKVLTAKRTSGAAGSHVNKKRQAQLQPKHRGQDDLDESLKSKLAGAALAGALATGAAAGNLPDLVGKVTMNVDGQQVTKEFNLGNDYSSPQAAQRDLEKFLQSKGINNFYIQLERAAPDNKFQPQDTRPGPYGARSVAGPGGVVDTAGQVARDVEGGNWKGAAEKAYKTYQQNKNADMGAVGRGELKDRIVRGVVGGLGLDEDVTELSEEMEQYLYQLDAAGYDILAEAEAIKGADGKRCWKGKRYAGTKNGKDICVDVNEEKKGLYYYVNQRKKKGTSRPKNDPKAPSAQDWKDAAKTAKK